MIEKPILFSSEMVKAILDGRKTQTRRIVKPQPEPPGPSHWYFHEPEGWWTCGNNSGATWKCPYGTVGDQLWVRESFRHYGNRYSANEGKQFGLIEYLADGSHTKMLSDSLPQFESTNSYWLKHRPSTHMPRWASRITLEITDVRVERLNEISENDAISEGLTEWKDDQDQSRFGIAIGDVWESDPRQTFCRLWDKINGKKYPWASNPFVWVIEFRRAK